MTPIKYALNAIKSYQTQQYNSKNLL